MTKVERQILENQVEIMQGLALLLQNASLFPTPAERAMDMSRLSGRLEAGGFLTKELLGARGEAS